MIQDIQNLMRTTLAASDAFQSLVDASDATEALARIYNDELPKPASGGESHSLAEITALRPCAIVYTQVGQGGWRSERDAMGDGCWNHTGTLVVVLLRNVPVEDKNDLAKVDSDFRIIAGNVISELIELNETAGYLTMNRIDAMGPYRTPVEKLKSEGDAQAYEIVIGWGSR